MANEPQASIEEHTDDASSEENIHEKRHCPFAKMAIVLCLVLSLVAIALSYIVWVRSNHHWQLAQTQLQNQVQAIAQQQANAQGQLTQSVKTLKQQVAQTSSQSASVRALNQARYLVRLANMNLNFNRNTHSAISLLKQAEQQIAKADDPALNNVRQMLIANVSQLTTTPSIDATHTLLQLNQLIQQVMKLQVIPSRMPAAKTTATSDNSTGWKRGLHHAWQQLKSLVVIRHQSQPIEPLLAPSQFTFLKDNVSLQLVQAQWAVLHQSNALYQQALQSAITWLNQYDNHNQADIGPIVQQLKALQKQDATPHYPTLVTTLQLINTTQESLSGSHQKETAPLPTQLPSSHSATNLQPPVVKPKAKQAPAPSLKKLLPKTNKSVEI